MGEEVEAIRRHALHSHQGFPVEMEGAAAAQICWQNGVACVIIRCLSDSADENAGRDYEDFYQVAARNSGRLVLDVIRRLAAMPIPEKE